MELSLNRNKVPFWILRAGGGTWDDTHEGLSLNNAEPGPIHVDFQVLSTSEKYRVVMGLLKDEILSPQKDELFAALRQRETSLVPTKFAQQSLPVEKPSISISLMQNEVDEFGKPVTFTDKAKHILSNGTMQIKQQLAMVDNTSLLRTLLNVEASGKNRNTVVKLIKDKLFRIEQEFERKRQDADATPIELKDVVGFESETGEDVKVYLQDPEITTVAT